jgi:hypothetical protein
MTARLEAVRQSITHPGEKGRALEHVVRTMLRELLPTEYGVSTGFVVWLSPDGPQLSSQLDIIIYDAARGGPLLQLATCDVFPLEAVYGYVEVKAQISGAILSDCIARNYRLRQMNERQYVIPECGSPSTIEVMREHWLSIRSYVVAFEAVGDFQTKPDRLAARMRQELTAVGVPAHVHGVVIPNFGMFFTRPVDTKSAREEDYFHVLWTPKRPLLAFKDHLMQGLSTFQRIPESCRLDYRAYFQHVGQWNVHGPIEETGDGPLGSSCT